MNLFQPKLFPEDRFLTGFVVVFFVFLPGILRPSVFPCVGSPFEVNTMSGTSLDLQPRWHSCGETTNMQRRHSQQSGGMMLGRSSTREDRGEEFPRGGLEQSLLQRKQYRVHVKAYWRGGRRKKLSSLTFKKEVKEKLIGSINLARRRCLLIVFAF